jgi:hypothetical protein
MPPLQTHFQALLLIPLLWLTSCQSAPPSQAQQDMPRLLPLVATPAPDLSGHWEKNFNMSDDFSSRIALFVADIQRRYTVPQGQRGRGDFAMGGTPIRAEAINGLARFAEELTRIPLLEILQDDIGIHIERENDFSLRCSWQDGEPERSSSVFGIDACGWSGQRLLFSMTLQGGLGILHQFSLSADGSMLDLTTTVSSDSVAAPLIIRNVYQRYEPPEENYNCILTLTRSRVCTQRGTPR